MLLEKRFAAVCSWRYAKVSYNMTGGASQTYFELFKAVCGCDA